MSQWIKPSEQMPPEHDAGILTTFGVDKVSDRVIVTIMAGDTRAVTTARTYDGVWKPDSRRFPPDVVKPVKVAYWQPFPAPCED